MIDHPSITTVSQRGFTLFEMTLVLVVSAILAAATVRINLANLDNETVAKAASDLKLIGEAGQAYIAANSGTSGSLYTMGTNTVTLTIANLQAAGSCGANPCLTSTVNFNPPGAAASNSYLMRINRTGTAPNFVYTAAAMTTKAWLVGGVTRLDLAGAAARKIGGQGLISYTATSMDAAGNPGTGAATIVNTDFPEITAIGQVGYMVSGGTMSVNDSLYVRRDGLYPMTGALQMGANNITGANAISGAAVTTTGAVTAGSVTSTGAVNAGSVTSTGAVSGNSVTSTTSVTAASATINGALAANGNITVNSTSDIVLNKLGGTNNNVSNRLASAVPMAQYLVTLNATSPSMSVPYPSCGTGGTAKIQITNNVAVGGVYSARWGLQVQTVAGTSSWTLNLLRGDGTSPPAGDPDAIGGVAITYCTY